MLYLDQVLKGKPVSKDKDFSLAASYIKKDPVARHYMNALKKSPLSRELTELPFEWTNVRLVSDDPSKAMDDFSSDQSLLQHKLLNILDSQVHAC